MHLLCFLNLAKPGIFARAMIFGAQGACHRFFPRTLTLEACSGISSS